MKPKASMTGIEKLRAVVNYFNACVESFNDPFTPAQLVAIYDYAAARDTDDYPDTWSKEEIKAALKGARRSVRK
jgi:hypothetical protein